jgi:uncharacterized protein YkuJ
MKRLITFALVIGAISTVSFNGCQMLGIGLPSQSDSTIGFTSSGKAITNASSANGNSTPTQSSVEEELLQLDGNVTDDDLIRITLIGENDVIETFEVNDNRIDLIGDRLDILSDQETNDLFIVFNEGQEIVEIKFQLDPKVLDSENLTVEIKGKNKTYLFQTIDNPDDDSQ